MTTAIFAEHAAELRRAGLAVLPADGKSPIKRGFNKMKVAPSLKTIEGWAKKTPDADIVFIPGLSRTRDGCEIIILDCDTLEMSDYVDEEFGWTPARTRTRKGRHHGFKAPPGTGLGKLHGLREFGLDIDVKHGQSQAGIVVAPPSRHQDERSFTYTWEGCDETAFRDPPTLDVAKLLKITERRNIDELHLGMTNRHANVTRPPAPALPGEMRDGSRGQHLNDRLCAEAPWCESINDVLDCAFTINQSSVGTGHAPLDSGEVLKRANEVWSAVQSGKLVRMQRRSRATCMSDADEIGFLNANYTNGSDAFTLLMKLRAEHGARASRGESFKLNITAMANAGTVGKWSARRYSAAIKALVDAGHLTCVKPSGRHSAASFVLVDRARTHSVAARASKRSGSFPAGGLLIGKTAGSP